MSSLVNLKHLDLGNNHIINISPLNFLSNLKELALWNNQINDFSALGSLSKLEKLDLRNTQINDVSSLSCLSKSHLLELDLDNNLIMDIKPLKKLVAEWMHISWSGNPGNPTVLNNNVSSIIKS